jgi:hypothetical protein
VFSGVEAWLDAMEPWFYGRLALKDWEVGACTPRGLEEMAKGWMWREERWQDDLVHVLACLRNINATKDSQITKPQDLIRSRRLGYSRMPGY